MVKIKILKDLYLQTFNAILQEWEKEVDPSDIALKNSTILVEFDTGLNKPVQFKMPVIPSFVFLEDIKDEELKEKVELIHNMLSQFVEDFDNRDFISKSEED